MGNDVDDRKCPFCRRVVADGHGNQMQIADRVVVFCDRDWPRAMSTPTEKLIEVLALIVLIVPSALLRVIA